MYWRLAVGEFAYGYAYEVNELTVPPDPNRNFSGYILLGASGFLGLSSFLGWAVTRKRRWAFPLLMAFVAALAILSATRYTV
ncbi:MAG: hypothetical protein M3R13_11170 [Armatimonadota bacterium]|nr:hypothetical protein [Armatimonadota bacterium]